MPDISVIIATYNRADRLERVLESLVRQRVDDVTYEILVADNNSNDDTREVVRRFSDCYPKVHIEYIFVPEQGIPYARNAGVVRARAPLIAYIDDDVEAADNWLACMVRAFAEHPEVACIGGRVRPRWTTPRPSWLIDSHFGPIALQEWTEPFSLSRTAAVRCIATENFGCRRAVFEEVGLFSEEFPRGSDLEFQLRLWQAGKRGLYLPDIEVSVEVPAERLTRAYHRRWRFINAKYHALMWYRDLVNGDGVLEYRRTGALSSVRRCSFTVKGWRICAGGVRLCSARTPIAASSTKRGCGILSASSGPVFSKKSRQCGLGNRSGHSLHAPRHSRCDSRAPFPVTARGPTSASTAGLHAIDSRAASINVGTVRGRSSILPINIFVQYHTLAGRRKHTILPSRT